MYTLASFIREPFRAFQQFLGYCTIDVYSCRVIIVNDGAPIDLEVSRGADRAFLGDQSGLASVRFHSVCRFW